MLSLDDQSLGKSIPFPTIESIHDGSLVSEMLQRKSQDRGKVLAVSLFGAIEKGFQTGCRIDNGIGEARTIFDISCESRRTISKFRIDGIPECLKQRFCFRIDSYLERYEC